MVKCLLLGGKSNHEIFELAIKRNFFQVPSDVSESDNGYNLLMIDIPAGSETRFAVGLARGHETDVEKIRNLVVKSKIPSVPQDF